jgi:hypothetical protein
MSNSVVVRPCFIDPARNSFNLEILEGATIADMVATAFPLFGPHELQFVHAYVTGWECPPSMWPYTRPRPGQSVILMVRPAFGGGSSSFLQIGISVLTMGLTSAFAGPLGLALGISSQFASGLLGFGIQAIAGLLLNAFIPQPHQKKDKKQYSITGWKNNIDPDSVVPNLYGKLRFAPPMCAGPYEETIKDDRYLHAMFCFGYGPVDITDLRIGDTPFEHYHDFQIEIHHGYADGYFPDTPPTPYSIPDSQPFSLYSQQVIEDTFTMTLQYEEDVDDTPLPSNHVTAGNTTFVQLDFHFPEGLYHTNHLGDVKSAGVIIKIEYRKILTDTWVLITELHISKHKTKPFFKSFDWIPPERAQYEMRCTRLNIEQASARKHTQCDWVAVRSFRPEYPLNFPWPLAVVVIKMRATKQVQGMLDNFNALASRRIPDWDPPTQTWIERPTSNPGSAYRHELQGNHWAFPRTDDQIDLEEIQAFHEFCTLKGLTYDRLIDKESEWRDNLQEICAAGRATPQDRGDKWSVIVDTPRTVVMAHITPRNSFNFEWNTVYAQPPDAFRVKFLDKTNDYIEATRDIPWPDYVGDPVRLETIDLPGYVEAGLVYREARRRQLEIQLRPHRYIVSQDIESVINIRGDLVYLNHDVLDVRQKSSRVRSIRTAETSHIIELEDTVDMQNGVDYVAVFRTMLDNVTDSDIQPATSLRRSIRTVPGETRFLSFTGPGDIPKVGDLVAFGTSAKVTIECLIKSIESNDNLTARLTLLPHAPELEFLADNVTIPPWDGAVGEASGSVIVAPAVPIITNIISGEDTESDDVVVEIAPGNNIVPVYGYDLQHRLQGMSTWSTVSVGAGAGTVEFSGYVYGDVIEIQARAVGVTGLTSAWTTPIVTHVFGQNNLVPPENVTAFASPFQVNDTTDGVRITINFDEPFRTDLTYVVHWRIKDIDPANPGIQFGEWNEEIHNEPLVADAGRLQISTLQVMGDTILQVQIAAVDPEGTRSAWAPATPINVDTTMAALILLALDLGVALQLDNPDYVLRI